MLKPKEYIEMWLEKDVVWQYILKVLTSELSYLEADSIIANLDWLTANAKQTATFRFRTALKHMISGLMVNPSAATAYSVNSSFFYVDVGMVSRWFRWDILEYKESTQLPYIFQSGALTDELFIEVCSRLIQEATVKKLGASVNYSKENKEPQ